jgi:hypothetical protein
MRYAARIPARVVRRGETVELLTNDVSFRGAFLRTDAGFALRQLVNVTFLLPAGESVPVHAMVVHRIEPGGAKVPGVGLQFWGNFTSKPWDAFIQALRWRNQIGAPAARPTDKVRRSSERFKLSVEVVLDGKTVMTRDMSYTGVAVRTDRALPIGTRAQFQLSAKSGAPPIAVDVIVRRKIDEPGFKGLALEFVDVAPATKDALVAFVNEHGADEELVIVDVDDPLLL